MKVLSIVVPALLGLMLPSVSHADWPDFPFVHAEGEARMEVAPDNATISFTVGAFHKESAVGLETLQTQVRKVLAVLAQAGIPEGRITGFDLHKMVERSRDDDYNDLEILGYWYSRDFEVELEDLKKFSDLMARIMAVDNVSPINAEFDVDNREEVEASLVRQAGEDARRRAENLARSLGVSIESVFAISEYSLASVADTFRVSSEAIRVSAMRSSMGSFEDTIFLPDHIELHKSVNVLFKLQDR